MVLEADFDDDFGDFANSAQTYTPIFGSKNMTASATITGISVGDWVCNSTDSDDPREFSYEVAAVSGATLTLFLPWKGSTGTTKTLKVMPAAPIWGATSSFSFDINMITDNWWTMQGLEIRSSTGAVIFDMAAIIGLIIKDCIVKGTNSTELFDSGTNSGKNLVLKTRCFDYEATIDASVGTFWEFRDCLFDGNSAAASSESVSGRGIITYADCEFKNHTVADIRGYAGAAQGMIRFMRNCILGSTTQFSSIGNGVSAYTNLWGEDADETIGKSIQHNQQSPSDTIPVLQSDTSTLRSGGGNTSLLITPSIQIGTSEASRYLIFEYPIYATTTSKTYTVYFKSNATADWTASPTAAECWLELEAWGHATNNFRKITKSTGALDFTTDANYDQTLTVTVAPAQAGVAYLRLYYGKPKESAKDNKFFIDPKVVIS